MQKTKIISAIKIFLLINIAISSVGLFVNTMNLFDRYFTGLSPGHGMYATELSFMEMYGTAALVSAQFALSIVIYIIFFRVLDLALKSGIFSGEFLLWINNLLKVVTGIVVLKVVSFFLNPSYLIPNIWDLIRHSKFLPKTYTSMDDLFLVDGIFMRLGQLTNLVTLHISPMNGLFFLALLLALKQFVTENMKLKSELETVI